MRAEERNEAVGLDEVPPRHTDDGPHCRERAEPILTTFLRPEDVRGIAPLQHRRVDVLLPAVELDDDAERREPEVDAVDRAVKVPELDLRLTRREPDLHEPDRSERLADGLVPCIERREDHLGVH